MTKPKAPIQEVPSIATAAELLARLRERPKPVLETHLTPSGWQDIEIRRGACRMNEARIGYLEHRLDRAKQGFERDHNKAVARASAKRDFDLSQ